MKRHPETAQARTAGMVINSFSDGTCIAQLFALEITGHEDTFSVLSAVDSGPDVEPADDGALAYVVAADGERVTEVYVQPDRARAELLTHPDMTAEAASEAGPRVYPKVVRPPRTLMFVGDGAQVRWTLPAFRALVAALDAGEREEGEEQALPCDRFRGP